MPPTSLIKSPKYKETTLYF